MKTKIKRGKTICLDGRYFTEVKLNVHYLSIDHYGKTGYSRYIEITRFVCLFNEDGEIQEFHLIEDVFDYEFLFLFDNYDRGRFEPVKTKYRISSKNILDLINENFEISNDVITDMMFTRYKGSITTDFSEWGDDNEMLFTGDNLIRHPYYKRSEYYDEFINKVKLIVRQNKVKNLFPVTENSISST